MTDEGTSAADLAEVIERLLQISADVRIPEHPATSELSDDARRILLLVQDYEAHRDLHVGREISSDGIASDGDPDDPTGNDSASAGVPIESGDSSVPALDAAATGDIRAERKATADPTTEDAPDASLVVDVVADSTLSETPGDRHDDSQLRVGLSEQAGVQRAASSTSNGPQAPETPRLLEVPTPKPIESVKKSIYLPNARMGEPYSGELGLPGLRSARLKDPGGTSLNFDPDLCTFTGTPEISGDFQIHVLGLLDGKPAEVVANLAVIPDPKSLWVNLPSDPEAQFWKPDEDSAVVEGELLGIAASKRGRSHARSAGCRDDDFGLAGGQAGGWHVITVADGAGSAEFSRRGSQVAVAAVLAKLPPMLDAELSPNLEELIEAHQSGNPDAAAQITSRLYKTLATAAFLAAKEVEDEAIRHQLPASKFSTTLIICVARRVGANWFFGGFSIGDGGAALLDVEDGFVAGLTLPDSGEFAGQTRFLSRSEFSGGYEEVAKRIFFQVRPRFTALVLMTDGITDPKFPTESVFTDPTAWREFWLEDLTATVDLSRGNAAARTQLLDWLDFWSPGNHDDRTLAVLVPSGDPR